MATANDSKSFAERLEGSSPSPGTYDLENLAYVIGFAIGDGNLSNPNRRAVRLRITCDARYINFIHSFVVAIQKLLPTNKVSLINKKKTAIDISCYSNQWEKLLGWRWHAGSKHKQNVSIPFWIKNNRRFAIACLRGLFQTDGCLYNDRGYTMVNFVTVIPKLALQVKTMIEELGFEPKLYKIATPHLPKYTLRMSRDTQNFIDLIGFKKD